VFSILTVGELQAGVMMASDAATRAARLRQLSIILSSAPLVWIDEGAAAAYGELRAAATGRLPSNDLWIAAVALANDFTLTTADARQAALPLVRSVLVRSDGENDV
jgi:predicted nucleic acid-binding protein